MGKELLNSDKELLLIDLCARLPYGVKALFFDVEKEYISIIEGIDIYKFIKDDSGMESEISDIKPYLFPMSSMTVEQRCKVQNLLPNNCDISFKNQKITFHNEEGSVQLDKLEKLFNFFNLYHIDYRGLIPMGLAIDATGLNIY
jgi:hypothetical protein